MDFKNTENASMPMVALRGLVVFPKETLHFDVGRKKSIAAVKSAMVSKQDVFLIAQKNIQEDLINEKTLYSVGTVCEVKQIVRLPGTDALRVVVEGKYRAKLDKITSDRPYFTADTIPLFDKVPQRLDTFRVDAMLRAVKSLFDEYSSLCAKLAPEVAVSIAVNDDSGDLADLIASNIPLEYHDKQKILDECNTYKRLEKLCVVLTKEVEILRIENEINDKVQDQMDDNQREYYLREQLRAISVELNGDDSPEAEAEAYREKIRKIGFSKDDEEKLLTECDRFSRLQPSSPESAVSRTYLDEVLSLPWNKYTKDNLDIKKASAVLEREHYGLKEVKDRILELLAVRSLAPDIKGQIICLAGPPGVGKTSIAKSLAHAMNRNFARLSLGGVRDEAEIRGHRKTYIGAMPGNIISALKRSKSMNPLILLDEIDKLASDYKGDPSAALLEALDPEQNNSFRDHYIEIPVDLSKVLFVTTANDVSEIPAPLRDRMEIIEIFSYTFEEKFQIAKKHLIPKQLKAHGLKASQVKIKDDALKVIIDGYTKEAGVRRLERTIAKVLRKQAVKLAEGYEGKITVGVKELEDILGPVKYTDSDLLKADSVGVVNGLAWTSVGGEMLQIEALCVEGTGKLELTGSLGDVMKESAKAAYSYIRSVAEDYNIPTDFYKTKDIHLHFPEGAVPKDGPSAGIGIVTAMVSALSGYTVKSSVAMTGEVTLTGRVLPIGGLKEKSMAAYKSGIKTVIIPDRNLSDIKQFDKVVTDALDFVPVSDVADVLSLALNIERTEKHDKKQPVIPKEKANKLNTWQQ